MTSVAAGKRVEAEKPTLQSIFQPWVVCFSASLFFFFLFIQMNMFNSIGPVLAQSLHVDAAALASISDKYFLANVFFLFPAGMLLDRFSTRRLICWAMAAAIICTYLFSIATVLWQMQVLRFITGVAGSFCLLSTVRLASRWFPPRKMALVIGLIITFAMLGGMVAQTPLSHLVESYGWRRTIMIDAVFGVLLWVAIFLWVRDYPAKVVSTLEHVNLQGKAFWQALGRTLCKPQNWFAGLYTSLLNLPLFIFGALWGVFYLVQVWHLPKTVATNVTSMFFAGVILGSPLIGWFSDKLQRRKLPMILGSIFSLLFILILMFSENLTTWGLGALFFAIGFMSSSQIISYPLIAESNPAVMTATAEGFASVLIMAGGFVQTLFAYLLQYNWAGHYIEGKAVYSASDYQLGLSVLPIAFILSLLLAFFVKETHCRTCEDEHEHTAKHLNHG